MINEYGHTNTSYFYEHGDRLRYSPNYKKKYLGMELEVCGPEDCGERFLQEISDEIQGIRGEVDIKWDCTVRDGFEIVTQPMDLEYHLYDFPWRDICEFLQDEGFTSFNAPEDCCGAHTSLSIHPFSQVERLKIAHWWTVLERLHKKISQRATGDFCDMRKAGKKDLGAEIFRKYRHGLVLNFARNERIEFRQYKGTLDWESILGYVSYVDALGSFAKMAPVNMFLNPSWKAWDMFRDIMKERKYKILRKYINEKISQSDLEAEFGIRK